MTKKEKKSKSLQVSLHSSTEFFGSYDELRNYSSYYENITSLIFFVLIWFGIIVVFFCLVKKKLKQAKAKTDSALQRNIVFHNFVYVFPVSVENDLLGD